MAVEDKEQVFCLAFRATGKDLHNTTLKAEKFLYRSSLLPNFALNLEL